MKKRMYRTIGVFLMAAVSPLAQPDALAEGTASRPKLTPEPAAGPK